MTRIPTLVVMANPPALAGGCSVNTFVRDRKVYRDAMSEGLGVVEMDNPKAKNEIEELVKEIM